MNRSRPVNEQRCERAGGVTLSKTAGLLLILLASFDFWGSSALANSGIDIVIEGNPSLQDLDRQPEFVNENSPEMIKQ